MSQNPNDDQPLDTTAAETGPADTTAPDAVDGADTDATQVLDTAGTDRQFTQDDPLSVFDRGVPLDADAAQPESAPDVEAPQYATPPTTSYGTAPYGTASYGPTSYGTASYGPAPTVGWAVPPKPLVRTTPRTSTIVWGFIILAIGVGAISVAAGATLDVGLAMIWLLAAAGAVLIVASVVGAARRRNRAEGTVQG